MTAFSRLAKRLAVFLLIVAPIWWAYNHFFPTYPFRFKLTVQVETPDGLKVGSSVMQVDYSVSPILMIFRDTGQQQVLRGESVFVDLGSGRNLLLTQNIIGSRSADPIPLEYLVERVFDLPWNRGGLHTATALRVGMNEALPQARQSPPRDVPFERLPLLLRFRDLNNPVSFQPVDPSDLAATFGPGYRLSKVTMEPSDLALTDELDRHLPWLPGLTGMALDGGTSGSSNPLMLRVSDLKT